MAVSHPLPTSFIFVGVGVSLFRLAMRSKGDVSGVFLATVSHGIGFLFLFSGFQRQRFGIFLAAMRSVGDVSDVLLSFSRAFQRRRFGSFCGVLLSLSVVRSKGNVSRVFLATVSHGIGTKPAAQ